MSRPARRGLLAGLLSLAIVSQGGCSFALSGPRKGRQPTELPRCDTGRGLIFVDGIFAALMGVGAVSATEASGGGALVLALPAAFFAAAAVTGGAKVAECERAFVAFDEEIAALKVKPAGPARKRKRRPASPARTAPVAASTDAAAPAAAPALAKTPPASTGGPPSSSPPPPAAASPANPSGSEHPWSDFWRTQP